MIQQTNVIFCAQKDEAKLSPWKETKEEDKPYHMTSSDNSPVQLAVLVQ